jgi:hypothetical protein
MVPEEVSAKDVAHRAVPVWISEFQSSVWTAHPAMSFQLSPPSVEYWKSTVPVGAVVSVPGGVTVIVDV